MKKKILLLAACLGTCTVGFVSIAGNWVRDAFGWKYNNEDGTYQKAGWKWIDGNGDGEAECYYFDENGRLLQSTVTPDGYEVNEDGAWVKDGMVMKRLNGVSDTPGTTGETEVVVTETDSTDKTNMGPGVKETTEESTESWVDRFFPRRNRDYDDPYVAYYGVPNSTRIAKLNLKKKVILR